MIPHHCVCGHGRYLHKNGKCMATVNPCGCEGFETETQAQREAYYRKDRDDYHGRYQEGTYYP